MNIPPFVNFFYTMTMEDVKDQPEYIHIEVCETIADEHLIQAYEKR